MPHEQQPSVWYLAGPMTGLRGFNYAAFEAEAARLRAMGLEVVNPAEGEEPDDHRPRRVKLRRNLIRLLIDVLAKGGGVALLPGWNESAGALLERQIAEQLGAVVVESHKLTDPCARRCEDG